MKKNRFLRALAAAIAGLMTAACTSYAAGGAHTGGMAARQAGERSVSPAGIALAWIPAGSFTMGSPDTEIGRWPLEESPRRQVTVSSGFWMGVHPVTQEQWQAVMGGNPSIFAGGRRPVENISWYDALVFANRLSIMEGLSPAYSIGGSTNPDDWGDVPYWSFSGMWDAVVLVPGSTGWRLPTEAQWEFAARAGTNTAFSNGAEDWQDAASIDAIGWFDFNSGGMTQEVGAKQSNPWGLYDIHGNVWEWVWDWLGSYPDYAQTDPTGAASGHWRVLRGGGWASWAQAARSAFRFSEVPFTRDEFIGLRVIRP